MRFLIQQRSRLETEIMSCLTPQKMQAEIMQCLMLRLTRC